MASYPSRTPGPLGSLEDRVANLEKQLRQVTSPTAEQYAQAVASLNTVDSTMGGTDGVGQASVTSVSGYWFEWVTMPGKVAAGKSAVDGLFIAQAAMVDMTSGGGATLSMRFVVRYSDGQGNDTSVAFQAAKNAGASAVNNVVSGSFRIARTQVSDSLTFEVGIQIAATNPAAFPNNSGNFITGSGIFTSSRRA